MNKSERDYIHAVKSLPCCLCGKSGPSDAHHILEGRIKGRRAGHFCTIPLCKDCHQGKEGIHGNKAMLKVKKENELSLLGQAFEKLFTGVIL